MISVISRKNLVFFVIVMITTISYMQVLSSNIVTCQSNQYTNNVSAFCNINQLNITFDSCGYSLYGEIYYPDNITDQKPGIIFCEGGGAYVSAYSWLPRKLARQGYITFIFDYPGQGKSEGIIPKYSIEIHNLNIFIRFGAMIESEIQFYTGNWQRVTIDAITYLQKKSPVKHLVNESNIGLIGHSLGGYPITGKSACDENVRAIVALSHANNYYIDKVIKPIQFQCGELDIKSGSIGTMLRSYKNANTPKELIVIGLGTHFGFTTVFNSFCPCPPWQKNICLHYSVAWFDYFLKNKVESREILMNASNHLSQMIPSRYDFGDGEQYLSRIKNH